MVNYGVYYQYNMCFVCVYSQFKSVYEMKVIFVKCVRPVHITFH